MRIPRLFVALITLAPFHQTLYGQFNLTPQDWWLPYLENSFSNEDQVQNTNYTVMDFNGDGKPDLIDAQDHTTGVSWNDGTSSYWKVYLNNGSGFSSTAQQWWLPYLENSFSNEDQVQNTNYTVMDFNGDGKPDLIDAQDHTTGVSWNDGTSSYWKVYINTGSSFNLTAQQWWLPYLENSFSNEDQVQNTNYTVIDFNGDGKPDLVDAQDHTTSASWNDGTSSYWKVYINTGSSFNLTAQQWWLPYLENSFSNEDQVQNTNYTVMDFNGDGKPDLIDAQDHTTGVSWNDGTNSRWKVYINSGTAFSSTAQNWMLPYLENSFSNEDQVQNTNYTVIDFNGDGKPDLVDAQDHTTSASWNDGTSSYWKVYKNTGTGFNPVAESWWLPYLENSFSNEDQVQNTNYTVMDFNGDGSVDLIDAQNHATSASWNDGTSSYWKVYLNTDITIDPAGVNEITDKVDLKLYPNPASDWVSISTEEEVNLIEILDFEGKLLLRVIDNTKDKIDISTIQAGTYVMLIYTDSEVVSQKFVKI